MRALLVMLTIAGFGLSGPARSDDAKAQAAAAWAWAQARHKNKANPPVVEPAGRGVSPVVAERPQRDESRPAVFQPRWVQFRDGRWWQEVSPGVYQRTIPYSAPAPIYGGEACGPGG